MSACILDFIRGMGVSVIAGSECDEAEVARHVGDGVLGWRDRWDRLAYRLSLPIHHTNATREKCRGVHCFPIELLKSARGRGSERLDMGDIWLLLSMRIDVGTAGSRCYTSTITVVITRLLVYIPSLSIDELALSFLLMIVMGCRTR